MLAALPTALLIERVARAAAREHAARARGLGSTWLQIADAAGLDTGDEPWTRAHAAFELAAGAAASRWRDPSAVWTCRSCGQRVTGHGPEAPQGQDEIGHANTCTRRNAQLAACQAIWDGES